MEEQGSQSEDGSARESEQRWGSKRVLAEARDREVGGARESE